MWDIPEAVPSAWAKLLNFYSYILQLLVIALACLVPLCLGAARLVMLPSSLPLRFLFLVPCLPPSISFCDKSESLLGTFTPFHVRLIATEVLQFGRIATVAKNYS